MQIRLIGPPRIEWDDGSVHRTRGHKGWGLLARLALGTRPLSRRQLASELFGDADDPLGALRWTLAELRRRLGNAELLRGDPLTLDLPASVLVDVVALEDGSLDPLQLDGELLEGVDPAGGPEFASWLLVERQRVAARLDAALRHSALLEAARTAGRARQVAWSLANGGRTLLLEGETGEARRWLRESLEVVGSERWTSYRPWPEALLAEVDLVEGRAPEEVRTALEQTFALSCEIGDPCWEAMSARVIGMALRRQGDSPAALAWMGEARTRCRRVSDPYVWVEGAILAEEAEVAAETGDQVRTEAAARALLSLAARTHMDGFLERAFQLLGRATAAHPG